MKVIRLKHQYLLQDELNEIFNNIEKDTEVTLCSFASYGQEDFDDKTLQYIREISTFFTCVVIFTNNERELPKKMDQFPSNSVLCYAQNQCLDFGFHWRLLIPLSESEIYKTGRIRRIGLVNDSCELVGSLESVFTWASKEKQVWGITKSYEDKEHLQSYFLVFQSPESVTTLLRFCQEHNIYSYPMRQQIISHFEIGLSQYFIQHHFELFAAYTSESVTFDKKNKRKNPTYLFWKELLQEGCPVLKKKRRR